MGEGSAVQLAYFLPFGSSPKFLLQGVVIGYTHPDARVCLHFHPVKAATPSDLQALSSDCIKSDLAACQHLADCLSVQSLLCFQKDTAREFQQTPLQHDLKGLWLFMHQLLFGAAMAIQPLAVDAAGSACCAHMKLWHNVVRDTPVNAKQELMMVPILSPQAVDPGQTREAMRTTSQVVKVLMESASKPQAVKPSAALALAKQLSALQQTGFCQAGPSKGKDKPTTSMSKGKPRGLQSVRGPHHQKQGSSSSRKTFS